ncbi:tRNA dimethylallyltransferase [Candidatus Dojkabacteria bacterium]|nr:tRNA dimethylallyltransferase [Candidatus Dojkabacteria bacterium]
MIKLPNKIYIIGGPTASGKTSKAIELAREVDGEIVNADSMQVYEGMDIGTNKEKMKRSSLESPIKVEALERNFEICPFEIEGSGVIGWMFDIVPPDFNFTVAHFQILAIAVIKNIIKRKKTPIIVGGSGLYIDGLIKGYEMKAAPNPELRRKLEVLDLKRLQQELENTGFDLDKLNESDQKNPRRLIRKIEKQYDKRLIGKSSMGIIDTYEVEFYYPNYKQEELIRKIEKRAEEMVNEGLIEEVEALLAKGFAKDLKSMQATGYRQTIEYIDGVIKSKGELIEKIALAHKQYAKRQITWFEGEGRSYDLHRF